MNAEAVARWAAAHPLTQAHVDCATAVMLKILDGKCKMAGDEKAVMAQLYDTVKGREGLLLGTTAHALIAQARRIEECGGDPELRELVYEKRVLAETMISRPVMKGFKALIREQGLFDGLVTSSEEE
ncbi:MAG: hypothetical protein HZA64_14725 [Rhodocyclales bacterium]|nr:hypothetical protein [Rhodocyclales bacterium]MBI5786703.1 hypothetical protein [Rhodocyclales bacterium]